VVCGVVLAFVCLEWFHTELIEIISRQEAEIGVPGSGKEYLTPRLTELRAASLKDSSGS
jgi:hypothetical protein